MLFGQDVSHFLKKKKGHIRTNTLEIGNQEGVSAHPIKFHHMKLQLLQRVSVYKHISKENSLFFQMYQLLDRK